MSAERPASKAAPLLDLEFDGGGLYALRSTVAAHALEAGLGDGWVNDLVGAAHELAANAVVHGGGRGRLRLWKEHEALHLQVSDSGEGNPGEPARWGDSEGSGLWMVRRMVDQMDLRTGPYGTIVTISLAITDASRLRITISEVQGWRVLALSGDLDLRTVPDLTAAVSEAAGASSRLVLDLAEVAFIDSSGFAALIGVRQTFEALPSGALVLAAPSERLTRRLRTLGLYDRFRIHLTVAEAVSVRLGGYPDTGGSSW
ncbi:anti-sigma factor antagonist [Actinocorallia longicatena]|uniref:Anti-sigma factor antagonist n=1 Tax=Actinocorallia longicatena TaxID=111803 RepID=A0ABP6QCC3_9ACTN